MTLVSVIICTYNREKYLPLVFGSILQQTLSYTHFEIIIINNNSPGNTKELSDNFIKSNPNYKISYFEETNQGLSFARNRGIKESKCDLITFIDDDAVIANDYLEKLFFSFKNHPNCVAIGGKILLKYEGCIPKWENKYLNSLLGYFNPSNSSFYFKNTNYPRGSNMTFKKKVFDQIGFFNTNLGRIGNQMIGGEEKELFERIYKYYKDSVLYDPSIIVYHFVPETRITKDFIIKQAFGTGRSELYRSKEKGKIVYYNRIAIELKKWFYSVLIASIYYLTGRIAKANMILIFRLWVTYGLLNLKKQII